MQQSSTLAVRGRAAEPPSLANAFADTVLLSPRGERTFSHSGLEVDSARVVGMVNALGVTRHPHSTPPPALVAGQVGEPHILQHHVPLRFTGSGLGYLPIWVGNLLAMLLTLGLFHPWAKARRLRYFHRHTQIDGHPLAFHGAPKKMLLGHLLLLALATFTCASIVFSPVTGLMAWLVAAGLVPMLCHSALKFRISNTQWRGLRLRFNGHLGQTYQVLLPMFVPGLVVLVAALGVPPGGAWPGWFQATVGVTALASLLAAPGWLWQLKCFQHNHFALGSLQTELRGARPAFRDMSAKALLMLAGCAVVSAGVAAGVASQLPRFDLLAAGGFSPAWGPVLVGGLLLTLLVQLLPGPFVACRLQNLLWSRTGNNRVRFKSELRLRDLMVQTLKNSGLTLLTLGLYWPFARVATARLRLEAVTLISRVELDELVLQTRSHPGPRMVSSLFALDVGL